MSTYDVEIQPIESAAIAYANHHHLRIRPDYIWLTILAQFSFYFQARAEQLRNKVVNFKGKKQLEVKVPGSTGDYSQMIIPHFLKLIGENSHGRFHSCTTVSFLVSQRSPPVDNLAATRKCHEHHSSLFEYTIFFITCGLPLVTLDGTIEG